MNPFIDCAAAEPQIFPFNIWDQRCIETNKCTDLYTILLNIFPLTLGSPPDPGNLSFSWAATLDCIGKGRVFPGAWASSLVFPALANVKLLKTSLSLNISHQFWKYLASNHELHIEQFEAKVKTRCRFK